MSVVRCSMGHYYDDSKFSYCPHCGVSIDMGAVGASQAASSAPSGQAPKKKGLFFWKNQADDSDKTVAFSEEPSSPAKKSGVETSGAGDSEKTVALSSVATEDIDDQKTVGIYSGAMGNAVVTGWIVCTEGPERGRDYRIKNGFNYIGRAVSSDIVIMDDPAISKDKQCAIVYDNKNIVYMAVPGNGTLTYINDELLAKPVKLESGDVIKMGTSTFVFIPFCKEGRVWED